MCVCVRALQNLCVGVGDCYLCVYSGWIADRWQAWANLRGIEGIRRPDLWCSGVENGNRHIIWGRERER